MSSEGKTKGAEGALPKSVAFDYLKATHHRVIHADGFLLSPTLTGDLHLAIWSQRFPYPKQIRFEVQENGQLGKEMDRDVRDAVVREVEAGFVVTPEVAFGLIDLIEKTLANLGMRRGGKRDDGDDGDDDSKR